MKSIFTFFTFSLFCIISFGQKYDSTGLKFNGQNTKVKVTFDTVFTFDTNDFTLEAIIRAAPSQLTYPQIISTRDSNNISSGLLFGLWSSGQLYMLIDSWNRVPGDTLIDLRDSVCHHVAVSRYNDTLHFYVDEYHLGNVYIGKRILKLSNEMWFGWDHYSTGNTSFNGEIREVRIWNTAKTQQQIRQYEDELMDTIPQNLIGYWRLNEGTGQIIEDFAGTNNGVLGRTSAAESIDPQWVQSCPLIIPDTTVVNPSSQSLVQNNDFNIDIYPNPSSGRFHINTNYSSLVLKMLIFDLNGSLVMEVKNNEGYVEKPGIYFVQITSLGSTKYKKLIIK